MKKKLLALALFAVMVFTLIPIANAATDSLAYFAVKGATTQDIVTKKTGSTYEATVEEGSLVLTYADKYDATGAPYYGVYIPVYDTIKPLIGVEGAAITLNGEKIDAKNFLSDNNFYYAGYADMKKGFDRTFTWVATKDGQSVTVKYTVKLNIKAKAADKPTGDLAYSFAGSGDGWAITTKNGAICLDIAADYILNHDLNDTFTATAKLTVGGKSPIPDGSYGYLKFELTNLVLTANGTYDADKQGYRYKNTETIKVTFPALSNYIDDNDEFNAAAFPITDTMKITIDTKATDYLVKGVRYIIRTVEVGDPHGISFVDGDVKNVGVGDVFTLELKGNEATLMTSANLISFTQSNNIVYMKDAAASTSTSFVAIGSGTVYITASYLYEYTTYTDTIKVIVTDTPATTQYYVVCRALNIRKGPGTSYSKAGLFYRNDVVDVVSVSNGWAKIWYKSATYYVSFKYLAKV